MKTKIFAVPVVLLVFVSLRSHAQFTGTDPVYTNANVGIGFATSPSFNEKLIVNGNILLTGNRSIKASGSDENNIGNALNLIGASIEGESGKAGDILLEGGTASKTNEGVVYGGDVIINGGLGIDVFGGGGGAAENGNIVLANKRGNVNIGAVTPFNWIKLNVVGSSFFQGRVAIGGSVISFKNEVFKVEGQSFFNGAVGIGTSCIPANHIMAVKGKIMTEGVRVALANAQSCWPDYVFDNAYKLPELKELEQYIKQNKHLSEIPDAMSIEKDGLSLEEMQILQMKKIEELTLYILQLNKKIEVLESELQSVKNK